MCYQSSYRVGGAVKIGKTLVTSGWPYLNVTPHIGNLVGSILSADVFARYCRLKGEEVVMVSGSDEHGTPIEVEAIRLGISPKTLTDRNHAKIVDLLAKWEISFDNYTRTESATHKEFVRHMLTRIYDNGYIFTQETEMLYCEHCGRFLPDRFVEGKCPYCSKEGARGDQCDNCGRLLEPTLLIEPYCAICKSKPIAKKTKHWYFDMPKLSTGLTKYLNNNGQLSTSTKNLSLTLIKEGLKPRAVTRDVEWGIPAPFPGSEGKTIYVWIEALLGYISATIEYFKNKPEPEKWREFWFGKEARSFFFIGKDNIPFHTIILPALLIAAGEDYNLPWNVSATEWLQFKGEKASKSHRVGIFIDEALELFPPDYWRYTLMASRPENKDTNFSWELFTERVNADLNDTLGNFVHRTLTFINTQFNGEIPEPESLNEDAKRISSDLEEKVKKMTEDIEGCRLQMAANMAITIARMGNQYLNEKEPWNLIKSKRDQAATILYVASQIVKALTVVSAPFIPSSAEGIWKTLNLPGSVHEQKWTEALSPLPAHHKIAKAKPLFKKVEEDEKELDERLDKIRASQSAIA